MANRENADNAQKIELYGERARQMSLQETAANTIRFGQENTRPDLERAGIIAKFWAKQRRRAIEKKLKELKKSK